MARGRDLLAKGIKSKEREETRWKEIESGRSNLATPDAPRAQRERIRGHRHDRRRLSSRVIYTPFATPETGLPIRPVPGGPWLMFPGTPTAHIMIDPPKVVK